MAAGLQEKLRQGPPKQGGFSGPAKIEDDNVGIMIQGGIGGPRQQVMHDNNLRMKK